MRVQAVGKGAVGGKMGSWGACRVLLGGLDFSLWLVERTEGCKQLVESMPVTVSCARLLTDAPLRSHNTPQSSCCWPPPAPPHFQMRKWRLRGVESLTEL